MKPIIIASLLGLALGWVFARAIWDDEPASKTAERVQSLPRHSVGSRLSAPPAARALSGRYLDRQRAEAQGDRPFNPYRARLLSADLVDSLSTDQMIEAVRAGQIHSNEGLRLAFTRITVLDPRLALELLDLLPRGNEFNTAQAAIISSWTAAAPHTLLDHLRGMSARELRSKLVTRLAHEWAELDPPAAMGQLLEFESLLTPRSRMNLAGALLAGWAENDFDAAAKWIEVEAAPERCAALRDSLLVGSMERLANRERIDFILEHGDVPALQRKLTESFQSWAMFEPRAALERFAAMPEDHPIWREVKAMGGATMMNLAMNKLDLTQLESMQQQIPAGELRRQYLLGAANTASSNDLEAARSIIAQIPESREREQAVGMFSELYMRKDPVALSEWLSSLDPSPSRDVAVTRFVSLLGQSDPERARAWAETVSDPGQRGRLLEEMPVSVAE
ncbi:MAG: hypothetical protein ACR2RV_11635 [Verrucomicrobiales bacterium]